MVHIFTDGSSCGRRIGPGGWSFVVVKRRSDDWVVTYHQFGGQTIATNNQMELMGPIQAIKWLHRTKLEQATIISDSQYVLKGITEWVHGWKRNGWRSSSGSEVLNKELWQQLYALKQGLDIEWKWVRGHAGNQFNELADKLAKQGKEQYLNKEKRNVKAKTY